MNPSTDISSQYDVDSPVAYAPLSETRPMYWSVRRELWENRSLYLAPLIVAAIVLFASLAGTMTLPAKVRNARGADPVQQQVSLTKPLKMAPAPIMLTTFIVGIFYCIDALHGERRDRSILFWKSLPVSDRTTVLAKAGIPLVVLPLIAYVLSIAVQIVLLFASTLIFAGSGISPVPFWSEARFFSGLLLMAYGLAVHALWFAPIYGWLLLVSAWARRAVVIWALMPFLAISAVERLALGSSQFMGMLQYRVMGAMREAFVFEPGAEGHVDRLSQLLPGRFLATPGLWVGLVFATICIAAAIRLRRLREPI